MSRSLGAVLRARETVTEDSLAQALHLQSQTGGRLGDILLSSGSVGTLSLYQAIADHYGLRFINLLTHPPEANLPKVKYLEDYIRLKVLPWRRELGTLTFATSEPSEALDQFISKTHGEDYKLAITSPLDIRLTIEQLFTDKLSSISVDGLYHATPERSAKSTLTAFQKLVLASIIGSLLFGATYSPVAFLLLVLVSLHLLYVGNMVAKTAWYVRGIRRMRAIRSGLKPPLLKDHELPIYTIMLPMYKEAEVLPGLLSTLSKLDYPHNKLDIKIVLEASDLETYEAAKNLKPAYHFDIIRVPSSQPQTKPKALNYAVHFAKGEIVTIYDAEDHPEPDQLRKAATMFAYGGPKLACVQGRLQYFNAHENTLTRWFEMEYQTLFGPLLHALVGSLTPIPLGGTSNHINLRVLKSLGVWDPYNVTEDADLGVRLAASGFETAMLDSITYEEATMSVGAWIRQRSRWVKGHMQTWVVYMRRPGVLYGTLKLRGFTGFQLVIGMSWLTFITAPILWAITLYAYLSPYMYMLVSAIPGLLPVAIFNLVSFPMLCWLQASRVAGGQGWRFATAAAFYPFYWLLHSIASYKALIQLITKPHYWEKTNHGVTKLGAA